jgi:carbamoylphosphate synthase large subunit
MSLAAARWRLSIHRRSWKIISRPQCASRATHRCLIDSYLRDAIEVDVDCHVADGDDVVVAGILQHIEEAGVHSGDSACTMPPYNLPDDIVAEIRRQAEVLARA